MRVLAFVFRLIATLAKMINADRLLETLPRMSKSTILLLARSVPAHKGADLIENLKILLINHFINILS
jgi:hypothetical protein